MSNRKFNLDNEVQPEIHFRLLSISASKFENDWTSFPTAIILRKSSLLKTAPDAC
ncbi:MAG: hypothetical protein ACLROW_12350 [Roseburia faecis]